MTIYTTEKYNAPRVPGWLETWQTQTAVFWARLAHIRLSGHGGGQGGHSAKDWP
jgi:hypothetical protein